MRLEPLMQAHAAGMFKGLSDPDCYRYIPDDPPVSQEVLSARYRQLEGRRSSDGKEAWLNWALVDHEGEPHGYVQVTVAIESKQAWIAYLVFSTSQRKGYASEALRALLPQIREVYGLASIHAEIDTRNVASIRLVESLDFQLVKVVREADEFKGATSDEYHYCLL